VLATAWDDHSLYIKPKQPVSGTGLDQPMLWTVKYGNGRVFTTVLGHDVEAMGSTVFKVTLARGTEWAARGTVTLPLPSAASK
jgi:type 1 glutamine amidotransferase